MNGVAEGVYWCTEFVGGAGEEDVHSVVHCSGFFEFSKGGYVTEEVKIGCTAMVYNHRDCF